MSSSWKPAETANSAASSTVTFQYTPDKPSRVPTPGLFDVVVYGPDRFDLIPKTDIAKFLLGAWLHGEARVALVGQMPAKPDDWTDDSQRMDVERGEFRFNPGPLLSHGSDPFYTGLHLSDSEQKACRKLVDEMRSPARPAPRKRGNRK